MIDAPIQVTPAQRRVVELVTMGLTSGAVGRRLGISTKTVSSHLVAVYRENEVKGRVDLTRRYLVAGCVVRDRRWPSSW